MDIVINPKFHLNINKEIIFIQEYNGFYKIFNIKYRTI